MSAIQTIEDFLNLPPFGVDASAKHGLLERLMRETFRHHFRNNQRFRRFCEKSGLSGEEPAASLEDYPLLPASLFKQSDLRSVPSDRIRFRLRSSATSGRPSQVPVDTITAARQRTASLRILADFIGSNRRSVLFLDTPPGGSPGFDVPARAAASRGLLPFAAEAEYYLREREGTPVLDVDRLLERLGRMAREGGEPVLFGFTYLIHNGLVRVLKQRGETVPLGPKAFIVHIGGWKKLEEKRVSRNDFLSDILKVFEVEGERVIDVYGFTEQMGLVYPSAGRNPKVAPTYAEIIIRDPRTLEPVTDGREGLIQVLTPLPLSYPGLSVLTEDVGRIVGRGLGPDGRWGTRFEVKGRAEPAERRGCGDILGVVMEEGD
jgi:acyl-protein synthetase LuxE